MEKGRGRKEIEGEVRVIEGSVGKEGKKRRVGKREGGEKRAWV
jgi:hypothetical protein